MKAGDLCRVIKKGTHRPCQYGQHVVILRPLTLMGSSSIYYVALNQTTGKWHHHHKNDLEVICK